MEKLSRGTVDKWLKKHDWLQTWEGAGPDGRQLRYLTPAGRDIILIYDLEGNLAAVAQVVPGLPQMQARGLPGFLGPSMLGKS